MNRIKQSIGNSILMRIAKCLKKTIYWFKKNRNKDFIAIGFYYNV